VVRILNVRHGLAVVRDTHSSYKEELNDTRQAEAYRTPTKLVTRQNLKLTEDFCRTLYRFYCAGSYLLDARIL